MRFFRYKNNNIVLQISNFKNIVYYYKKYFNQDRYIFCDKCSCIELKKTNSQKYCKDCAKEVHLNDMLKSNCIHEEFRTIKCSNCGKEFQIRPKSKRTLCNECYNQKRKADIQRNKKI